MKIPIFATIVGLMTQFSNLGNGNIGGRGPLGEFLATKNTNYLFKDEALMFTGYNKDTGSWNALDAKAPIAFGLAALGSWMMTKVGANRWISDLPFDW